MSELSNDEMQDEARLEWSFAADLNVPRTWCGRHRQQTNQH